MDTVIDETLIATLQSMYNDTTFKDVIRVLAMLSVTEEYLELEDELLTIIDVDPTMVDREVIKYEINQAITRHTYIELAKHYILLNKDNLDYGFMSTILLTMSEVSADNDVINRECIDILEGDMSPILKLADIINVFNDFDIHTIHDYVSVVDIEWVNILKDELMSHTSAREEDDDSELVIKIAPYSQLRNADLTKTIAYTYSMSVTKELLTYPELSKVIVSVLNRDYETQHDLQQTLINEILTILVLVKNTKQDMRLLIQEDVEDDLLTLGVKQTDVTAIIKALQTSLL